MKASSCCRRVRTGRVITPASPIRRGAEAVGALASAATLILMPKCPMCLAAYLAVATGLGISVTTASHLRTAALAASVALLIVLAWTAIARLFPRPKPGD